MQCKKTRTDEIKRCVTLSARSEGAGEGGELGRKGEEEFCERPRRFEPQKRENVSATSRQPGDETQSGPAAGERHEDEAAADESRSWDGR